MNIYEQSYLPTEVWEDIFKHARLPLALSCTSQLFRTIFWRLSFDFYRDQPSLRERAEWIKHNDSPQEKVKALYESLMCDIDAMDCKEIKQVTFSGDKDKELMRRGACLSVDRLIQLENWLEAVNLFTVFIKLADRDSKLIEDGSSQDQIDRVNQLVEAAEALLSSISFNNLFVEAQMIREWFSSYKDHLCHVACFDLSNKILTKLPKEVQLLTGLKYFRIEKSKLTLVPTEIVQLTKLKLLNLNNNGLIGVPEELFRLTCLKRLCLECNQIESLSPKIGQLIHLKWLLLGSNLIKNLPTEIGQLTRLEWLGVGGNYLTSLPAEIGQLTRLDALALTNNDLTSLPAEISRLTNLTRLAVGGNQLISLPTEIKQLLTSLEEFEIKGNPLKELPADISLLRVLDKKSSTQFQHLFSIEDLNELKSQLLSKETNEWRRDALDMLISLQEQHRLVVDHLSSQGYLSSEELDQLQANHHALMKELVELQNKLPSSQEEMTAFQKQLEPYYYTLAKLRELN